MSSIESRSSNLLLPYFESGFPVVALETCEEQRVTEDCARHVEPSHWSGGVFTIAAAGGLMKPTGGEGVKVLDPAGNFPKAFNYISTKDESILLVFDFQHMVSSPQAYRPLLQALPSCRSRGSMIILVAPSWNLPAELKHEIPVIRLPLPSQSELTIPFDVVAESVKPPEDFNQAEYLASARGLTLAEAENVFALSGRAGFTREIVESEKMRLIRSSYMSVEMPRPLSDLGGLGRLKAYIQNEVLPARDDDQLRVRGVLLVGVPGSGKSLTSKVISSILRWPLVRLDVSACKGSLLGQSESNIRNALTMADAVSPCVLWLDEIEKAVGGFASSAATDGGTTLSMVGTLLTWMQEHESPVLVVGTCNDYQKLPAELTRAGRWDEKFFLDLPPLTERDEIARIHLQRLGCSTKLASTIARTTESWTGAEIEQLIKSAARRTRRNLDPTALEICGKEIIPISKTAGIQQLRAWASDNLRMANDQAEEPTVQRRVKHVPDPTAN
jgi:ATPase family protein associated with various cellular activities (AAA)